METNPLINRRDLFSNDLKKVDKKILSFAENRPHLISSLLEHILNSGGKRLRPILLILCSKLIQNGNNKNAVNMAACVELLHTATLFHDDVVDGSKMRRGEKTANEVWGNPASVLVGDFLLAKAFKIMSEIGNIKIIQILSETSSIITEGEIKQLMNKANAAMSYNDYISIITSKTAELFSACGSVGGLISDANNEQIKNLSEFGRNLGIAFQIADDIIDYQSESEKMGKKIGDDFREGKVTLPIIYLFDAIDESEKKRIKELFTGIEENRTDAELLKIIELMHNYNIFEKSIAKAKEYSNAAQTNLSTFADSLERTTLQEVLEFSIDRRF